MTSGDIELAPVVGAADAVAVVDEGVWYGPAGRPLAGRLHLPADRQVRGAVLLCTGVGHEYALGYAGARRLGQLLASARIAALHVAYDGVGDSWGGDTDPGRVAAWEASVRAAGAYVRDDLGVDTDPMLVGHRFGTTLAARAARDLRARALVLLDPVGGRDAARRFRGAATVQGFPTRDGEISADGMIVTDETMATLRATELVAPACPTLTVVPAVRTHDGDDTVWDRAEVADLTPAITGTGAVPEQLLEDVAAWLSPRTEGSWTVARTLPSVVVGEVRETVGSVGPRVTITTEPVAGARTDRPTVLMVSTAYDPRFGPSRVWAPWARDLAALGFRVVRADLTGVGDTPASSGPASPYRPESVPDVRALIAAADEGAGVALVGLCSGARNALDAVEPGSPVTDLLLVNPVLRPTREQLEGVTLVAHTEPPELTEITWRMRIARPFPVGAWRAAYALGMFGHQTERLRDALRSGARATIVFTPGDLVLLEPPNHHAATVQRLNRTGRADVREVDVEHSMLDPEGRAETLALLTAHLVGRYGAQ